MQCVVTEFLLAMWSAGAGKGLEQCEGIVPEGTGIYGDTRPHRGKAGSGLSHQTGPNQQVQFRLVA